MVVQTSLLHSSVGAGPIVWATHSWPAGDRVACESVRATSPREALRREGIRPREKAGGRYAADLVLQLPARGSGSVAQQFVFLHRLRAVASNAALTPLHAGMATLYRGRLTLLDRDEAYYPLVNPGVGTRQRPPSGGPRGRGGPDS
jgi:hypothetical protein